jgi:hypothetical protein
MSKEKLMKHLKTLGVFAMAAMALLVVASSASATAVYSSGAVYTGEVLATLEGSAILSTTGGTVLDTCTAGSARGKVEEHGATKTTRGKFAELTWGTAATPCTEPTVATTLGSLELHHITGTTSGTAIAKNTVVKVDTTIFGAECTYTAAEATHLGALNGSTSSNATIAINTVVTATNSFFCPDAKWQASYKVTTPANLYVEAG